MKTYHKIHSVFKRDENGNFTNEYSRPEFDQLSKTLWRMEEKIDGTNIRVFWDGETVTFGGRTNKAEIPPYLLEELKKMFTVEKFKRAYPEVPESGIMLFGEGYGEKIQAVGKEYLPKGHSFILFDVMFTNYQPRNVVKEVAIKLGIKAVPVIEYGTINKGIKMAKSGFYSILGSGKAEGLILKPENELMDGHGKRIIIKIKTKDFAY